MDAESDRKLYNFYLELFYNQGSDFSEFNDHFDDTFLKDTFEKLEFFAGKEIKQTQRMIKTFEKLAKEVHIKIFDSNKDKFKKDETVKINIELKNVPTLYIKIFEFNCENYYRKNLAPFKTNVNLDGLISSDEKVFKYEKPAQVKFRETFEFPELDNRVGLFVIEFISNGFSSRAVIKKGSLSLITKSTIAG